MQQRSAPARAATLHTVQTLQPRRGRSASKVIEDMGTILHDTCTTPEIARMFESTPEQLLLRLNKHAPGPTDK